MPKIDDMTLKQVVEKLEAVRPNPAEVAALVARGRYLLSDDNPAVSELPEDAISGLDRRFTLAVESLKLRVELVVPTLGPGNGPE